MLRRITLAALAAAALIAGAAPSSADAYLNVFNACGVDPDVAVGYGYGPTTGGPASPTGLYTSRPDAVTRFGGPSHYTYGRLTAYTRISSSEVWCYLRHRDLPDWGLNCDYSTHHVGSNASHTSTRSTASCYWASSDPPFS